MPSLKDFTDAMSATWPVALAILIGSSAVLVGDVFGLRYLAMLPAWFLGAAFLVAVFSGAIVLVSLLRFVIELAGRPMRKRRTEKWKARQLERLVEIPPAEMHVLAWAAQNGTQVFLAQYNHPSLEPLVAKGFIELVPGHHSIVSWPYRIPDYVWDFTQAQLKQWPPSTDQIPNPLDRGGW